MHFMPFMQFSMCACRHLPLHPQPHLHRLPVVAIFISNQLQGVMVKFVSRLRQVNPSCCEAESKGLRHFAAAQHAPSEVYFGVLMCLASPKLRVLEGCSRNTGMIRDEDPAILS